MADESSVGAPCVLHLSAVDYGGAGLAALRLHRAMLERGVRSHMFVWSSQSGEANVNEAGLGAPWSLIRFAGRAWFWLSSRRRYNFRHQRAACVPHRDLADLVTRIRPNLIVVHYISDFLDFVDLVHLQSISGARVVFHLLDMGLMTGGCHYSWGCRSYRESCGRCPALPGRLRMHDASARALEAKIEAVQALDHVVVAPSYQLAKDMEGAAVFANSRSVRIMIGVDSDRFGVEPKESARASLGIATGDPTVFFGAQRLDDPRKGMALLREALQILASRGFMQAERVQLLVAGHKGQLGSLSELDIPVVEMGILDANQLARAYSASDLFVCPSVEDSGPMMVNEAMMSGTPVVGFPVGVLPDLVVDGETGFLAARMDAEALADAIALAIPWCTKQNVERHRKCRERALEMCSLDVQVSAFVKLASNVE